MSRRTHPPARLPTAMGCALLALHCSGETPATSAREASVPAEPTNRNAPREVAPTASAVTRPAEPAFPAVAPLIISDTHLVEEPSPACELAAEDTSTPALERLSRSAVNHATPVRRTLYSWTRAAQIAELRADPTLLTRRVNAQGERGRAGDILFAADGTDPVAAVLAEERFGRTRHAWPNSWATIRGWTGEDYGDRLLSITLREEAWIASMSPRRDGTISWNFFDMSGAAVSQEQFLAAPEKLGAIYFVDGRDPARCGGEFRATGSVLREYILPNESMIERYSAFTEEIRAHLADELATLRELQRTVERGIDCRLFPTWGCWREEVVETWGTAPVTEALGAYAASLAFPNSLYVPMPINLKRLIARLEAVPTDDVALEHIYPAR